MGFHHDRSVPVVDREVAALLLEVFRPRMDLYAWRIDDDVTAARLNAWEREARSARARVWRVGEWRPAGPKGLRRPVTADDLALHVAGVRTLGVYPMLPDGGCHSVSVDFDDHRGGAVVTGDPAAECEALRARLREAGVPHLAQVSRGGRGRWVHVLTPDGSTAREARRVMHSLLRDAGVRDVAHGGTVDALFPKQDAPAAGPGNLFCLPLSRRWLAHTPPGTAFLDAPADDFAAQVYTLWKARRVDADRWRALVERSAPPPAPTVFLPPVRVPAMPALRRAITPAEGPAPHGAWALAMRRARRLGRPLGDGRHALLCVQDHLHSSPDGTVENARGSCVLFPPSAKHPEGLPWCAHAHCASLTRRDWIRLLGPDVWDDACLALRGMRRVGPWLLHPGGISGWYRDARGVVVPSRREHLCDVPLWIIEDRTSRRGASRVVEAVVNGRARRLRVARGRFTTLAWLSRVGVDPGAMTDAQRERLLDAIERLSEPVTVRALEAVDQGAAQARSDDLVALLAVLLDASRAGASNENAHGAARVRGGARG